MTGLSVLVVPILLSAVLVFVASSIIHMLLPWHKSDCSTLPSEDRLRDVLRPLAIPPGDYMVPRPGNAADIRTPEFAEKLRQGPVLMMTVMPNGPFSMRRNLILWFLYCVAMGIFAAYVASRALPPGAPYLRVFQLAGAAAFGGYVLALWQMSIWYHRAWNTTIKTSIDGLIYALLTAGTFGWLWPH